MKQFLVMIVPIFVLSIAKIAAWQVGDPDRFIYSESESLMRVKLTRVSSCVDSDIAVWNCTVCDSVPEMTDIRVMHNTKVGGQAYVAYYPPTDQIVVAFRGTVDVINWLYDLDALKIKYSYCDDCYLHKGFYNTYLSVRDQVFGNLTEMISKYPNSPVAIVGHSLGGAQATIFALEVVQELVANGTIAAERILPLYNYGSPRVGNPTYASFFNDTFTKKFGSFRVTHYKDIVPGVPLNKVMGFNHIGQEIYYSNEESTEYKVCDESGEDPTCASSLFQDSISDHLHYLGVLVRCQVGSIMEDSPILMELID